MREDYEKKIKSLCIVLLLVLSTLTVGIMVIWKTPTVKAAAGAFDFTTATKNAYNGGIFKAGTTFDLAWTGSANADYYWVGIDAVNGWRDTTSYNIFNISTVTLFSWGPSGPAINGTDISTANFTGTGGYINTNILGPHNITVIAIDIADDDYAYSTTEITVTLIRGTPGYDIYQGVNFVVEGMARDSANLHNNTAYADDGDWRVFNKTSGSYPTLEYGYSGTLTINNGSGNDWMYNGENDYYYLFYPVYYGDGSATVSGTEGKYVTRWWRYKGGSGDGKNDPQIRPGASTPDLKFGGEDGERTPTLNRSGLWLIGPDDDNDNFMDKTPNGTTWALFNSSIPAWFWVNGSEDLTIGGSSADTITDFTFGSTGTFDMYIKDDDTDDYFYAMTQIIADHPDSSGRRGYWAENQPATSGGDDGWMRGIVQNHTYFTSAGHYTAIAYWDIDGNGEDGTQNFYRNDSGIADYYRYWNTSYGNYSAFRQQGPHAVYRYEILGPWDPPEREATPVGFTVDPGTPSATVYNSTQYWNSTDQSVSDTVVNTSKMISVKLVNYYGDGIDINSNQWSVKIYNSSNRPSSRTALPIGGVIGTGATGTGVGVWRGRINNTFADPGYDNAKYPAGAFFNASWEYDTDPNGDAVSWINITPRGPWNRWGRNQTTNYAWALSGRKIYIVISGNVGGNATFEEWNVTAEATLAAPSAHFEWFDDDGVDATIGWPSGNSNTDGVIPYIPAPRVGGVNRLPLTMQFYLYDSDYGTYGSTVKCIDPNPTSGVAIRQAAENITITGNSLFTGTLDTFPGFGTGFYSASTGRWSVPIIPTMSVGGGTITITATCFNTTLTGTVTIGGANIGANGSVVSVTPNSFPIDTEDRTLTISVADADTGASNPYARVYLYYIDDGTGDDGTAGGIIDTGLVADSIDVISAVNGIYTMGFNVSQQTDNQTGQAGMTNAKAPANLTVYVDGPGRRDGFALIQMTQSHDLEVELSMTEMMAGYLYEQFDIDCTFAGNSTDTPSTKAADKNNFFVKVYNENDEDVTGSLLDGMAASDLTGADAYDFTFYDTFAVTPGTFTFYAYNNTHDSQGNNGTLTIGQVQVTSDKNPFIWMSDTNISATFTFTYNGATVNGSVVVDNMTDAGDYNRTYTNTSFTTSLANPSGSNGNAGNVSLGSGSVIDITNGILTISDITANLLEAGKAYQNLSFYFRPEAPYDGAYALCMEPTDITVSVPTVTPSPQYIPLTGTTTVYCTVTGRDTTLSDIFVRLHGAGFDQNGTSDVSGQVSFSINPSSTGNISIDVGQTGRTISTNVIVTNWVLDISADVDVNEGSTNTFTVTVMRQGTTIAVQGATVTITGIGEETTDANGQAVFTAPDVTSDRTYTIRASKEGYASDPDTVTITIINIPKLIISASGSAEAGATITVVVAKDTGDPVIGATILFDGNTYTTGAGGVVEITAPSTAGTYTITASFGTFEDGTFEITITADGGGIPGFELLTLIVAIGVAFILFRRRRQI
jgi:hypothetical protein